MSAAERTVPRNVLRFEALLYLSLLLDAVVLPFRSDVFDEAGADASMEKLATAALIGLFAWLIWLVARFHKNWARWALVVMFVLSLASILASIAANGVQPGNLEDLLSSILSAFGLYFSFAGDARGWFDGRTPRPGG